MATIQQYRMRLKKIQLQLEPLAREFDNIQRDMQADFDDRSERWQEGEHGEAWQSAIDDINEHMDHIDEASEFEIEG